MHRQPEGERLGRVYSSMCVEWDLTVLLLVFVQVKVKLKPRPRAVPGGEESHHGKRPKSSRWRRWSVSITLSRSEFTGPRLSHTPVSS